MEIIIKTKNGTTIVFTKNTKGLKPHASDEILETFKQIHKTSMELEGWEIVEVKND